MRPSPRAPARHAISAFLQGRPALVGSVTGMTRLVIVDDHEALREGLAALLEGHGMEVVGGAGNAAAGADLIDHAEPDVAIVDIRLPDRSGIELTREALRRHPDLGVVLYTGDPDVDLLQSGLDSGARGYALKAGSMTELV